LFSNSINKFIYSENLPESHVQKPECVFCPRREILKLSFPSL
jgi:hypothetical protein